MWPEYSVCIFHPQCHPARDGQRGKCWCVDQKTGLRLPGPLELRGELDCHQLMTATLRDWGVWSVRGRTSRTSLTLLVLISGTTCRKDFALKPLFTWGQGYKSLCNKKETIDLSSFAILSECVWEFVISESIFAPAMWTWDWCFEVTGGRQRTSTVKVVIFGSERQSNYHRQCWKENASFPKDNRAEI